MEQALIVLLALAAIGTLWWYIRLDRSPAVLSADLLEVPEGLSFRPKAVLTKEEAAFYNMLCLAVQEHYLVFAKVPVSHLVQVRDDCLDEESRAAWFQRRLGRTTVDFVLVHPGTLTVETVIVLEGLAGRGRRVPAREQLAHAALAEAGLAPVRLNAQQPHTIPGLAALLGLEPPE